MGFMGGGCGHSLTFSVAVWVRGPFFTVHMIEWGIGREAVNNLFGKLSSALVECPSFMGLALPTSAPAAAQVPPLFGDFWDLCPSPASSAQSSFLGPLNLGTGGRRSWLLGSWVHSILVLNCWSSHKLLRSSCWPPAHCRVYIIGTGSSSPYSPNHVGIGNSHLCGQYNSLWMTSCSWFQCIPKTW